MNKVFAFIILAISGFCAGAILLIDYRLLAIAIVAGLTLVLGINFWRASYKELDVKRIKERGFWKIKLYPVIMVPVIALALGAALSGLLMGLIKT